MELSQLNEKLINFHKLPIVETGEDPDNGSGYTIYEVTNEEWIDEKNNHHYCPIRRTD